MTRHSSHSTGRRDRLVPAQPRAIARDLRPDRSGRVLLAADRAAQSDRVLRRTPAGVQRHLVAEARARSCRASTNGSRRCSRAASIRTARSSRAAQRRGDTRGRRATRCSPSPRCRRRRSSRRWTRGGFDVTGATIPPCAGRRRSTRRSSTKRCTRRRSSICGIGCRTSRSGSLPASATRFGMRILTRGFRLQPEQAGGRTHPRRRGDARRRIAIASRSGGTTSSTSIASTCRPSTSTCTASPTPTSSSSSRPAAIAIARCGPPASWAWREARSTLRIRRVLAVLRVDGAPASG